MRGVTFIKQYSAGLDVTMNDSLLMGIVDSRSKGCKEMYKVSSGGKFSFIIKKCYEGNQRGSALLYSPSPYKPVDSLMPVEVRHGSHGCAQCLDDARR